MTNLKKKMITACLAGSVLLAGAALCLLPEQTSVSAAEVGSNSWVEYPRVSGWEYGSFGVENVFYALSEYGEYYKVTFHYDTDDENDTWVDKELYATADANGVLTYYSSWSAFNADDGYSAEEVASAQGTFGVLFNEWNVGNYTMTVTVPVSAHSGIEATVPFTVRQATNYWIQAPSIMSWNSGKADSLPTAQAKFGKAEYVIYSAKMDSKGDFETDSNGNYIKDVVYYDSVNQINNLAKADEGIYLLVATVAESASGQYQGLETTVVFRVFASSVTDAALNAAKEAAIDEIEDLAHRLNVTGESAVDTAVNTIKFAETVKKVELALESARLQVYRTYAVKEIKERADLRGVSQSAVQTQLDKIPSLNAVGEIEDALESALRIIEESYVHNTLAPAAVSEINKYAQDMGALADGLVISTENLVGAFGVAVSQEELEIALTAAKKTVARTAYQAGSAKLDNYRQLAKEYIYWYALYIGIEYEEVSGNVVLEYMNQAQLGDKTESEIKAVVTQAEKDFQGKRSAEMEALETELKGIIGVYKLQYPAVSSSLDAIMSRIVVDIYCLDLEDPTIADAVKVYEAFLSEIEECVLEPAKAEAIKQIDDMLEETGLKSFDRDSAVAAINAAESIEEVEALLEAALNEIGSTLYETRAEKMAELEVYAEGFYNDYNWRGILDALTAGKSAVVGAQKYSDILDKFEVAKLNIFKASVLAELDHYAEVYAAYGVSGVVENAKSELNYAHTEEECTAVLSDAEATICAEAKENAIKILATLNVNYPSWDRSGAEKEIGDAATVARVDEAYKKAEAELLALVSARDSAINSARDMLTVYAESYGVQNLDSVKAAITNLNTAQTAEDVPLLFDRAKLEIDRAAEAEQHRVDSVNTALIVLVVLFGFTALGLGVAFALVLRRYMPRKKKDGKAQNPPKQEQPKQEQPQQEATEQNPPQQVSTWQDVTWQVPPQEPPQTPPEN